MNITHNELLLIANIVFIVLYILYLIRKRAFTMNAKPLTDQPLFKAAIIIPIVSFLFLGLISWSDYTLQIDSDGFNKFFEISKLPLAALSLALPLGVIVNNIHRTIQTDKQIEEAERKNILDRYYAHRKNTIEILQNLDMSYVLILKEEINLSFQNSYSTYKKLYPFASSESNNYSPSIKFLDSIYDSWRVINKLMKKTNFPTKKDYYHHLNLVEIHLDELHHRLGLKKIEVNQLYSLTFYNEDGTEYSFSTMIFDEHCLKMNIAGYWIAFKAISNLLEIETPIEFAKEIEELLQYSITIEERYPTWATSTLINTRIPQLFPLTPA